MLLKYEPILDYSHNICVLLHKLKKINIAWGQWNVRTLISIKNENKIGQKKPLNLF